MLAVLVYSLASLHPLLHRASVASPAPDREDSPWLVGCVDASSGPYSPTAARDLDPVACSVRCLEEGYQIAALKFEDCFCGNWQHGLLASECFNTSSKGRRKDERGGSERQNFLSLPVGDQQGRVALYRTDGPFLHRVHLSHSPLRVQAGKTFVVKVSGNLAGRPNQPTGILALGGLDLSYVTINIQEMTYKGQSSHRVSVLDDGSFSVSSDWILETPREHELNVSVSNPLSTFSSTLHLSILDSSPPSLVISVLHGPLGVPSCIPFLPKGSNDATVKTVYLGDPVILQADVRDGPAVQFSWCFTQKGKRKNMEGEETVCLPSSDRLNSSVNWTFEIEGIHVVSVNASDANGWTQETINLVVVSPAVSSLRRGASGGELKSADAALLHRNGSYSTGEELTVVLIFGHTGTSVVERHAENRASSQNKSVQVCVEGNRKASPQSKVNPTWQPPTNRSPAHRMSDSVQIYAPKQAYPTNTDVTFLAVAQVPDPVEFLWHFGDSRSTKTTSRTITKRYHKPGRYDVVVVMSRDRTTRTSDVFPLVVQRAVKLNRLLHRPSVMPNQMVTFSCRVNVGTDVSFLWGFGDGSSKQGQNTEQHVFHRTGEFRVTVTVSNLVSSASLSSHVFVVDRPCQPPPVKNMGPLKLQVRRYEAVHLGVTYETEVDCDVSGGLSYTWTLFDSAGQVFPLPLIDTNKQSLILPSHLLHYDTYTAIAKIQVVGTMVYSNYSVRVQVIQSPPVAFIQGGTNMFFNNRNATVVTLDGQRSYDPDFPMNPVSFSWTCKPISSIASSCFRRDVPTSSPVLVFPASFLKYNFDQFQFTLTIHSGERSASSETYLTLTSNMIGKVSVSCLQCRGDQVNWDQSLSVSTSCEGCDVDPTSIQYTWSLYLVNASSKPVLEVPFCYTVDLTAPSTILEALATSPQAPATSTLHRPAIDASDASLDENASETGAKLLNLNVIDSGTSAKNNREKSAVALLAEADPSPISSLGHMRTSAVGEEPFYQPPGESDPPEPLYSPTEYQPHALDNSGVLYSEHSGQSGIISEFPLDADSSADWGYSLPVLESRDLGGGADWDYDIPTISPEEGDPGISAGRFMGVEGETVSPVEYTVFDPALHEDDGSNLVDSRPSVVIQQPVLLDLSRDLVDRGLFESYTYTAGISTPLLSFRPYSLKPGSRYMLDVKAESHERLLGRTQLFLKTSPAPHGMTCQVQPMEGRELYTHFSIFCSSGKEDLLYEYSISVGDGAPRILYQGRDFQHYFSLPSGEPADNYKVKVYSTIRSGTSGTATKPCPVTVRVQPSFSRGTFSSSIHVDPDLELSKSGLKNLSALVQLGNSMEVRNYVSLLSGILNRLSLDTEANAHVQRLTRNALICTMCELESREQASTLDNIYILKNLLQVTSQVSLVSAGQVTRHVQVISAQFSESGDAAWRHLDQKMLDTLIALLSYSLQAAVTSQDFTPDSADVKLALKSDPHEENIRNALKPSYGCIPESPSGVYFKRGGSTSANQVAQLVADILQTAADLMLKHVLFREAQELRVSTGFIALYAAYQNQTSTVTASGSATIFMTASLFQLLLDRRSRGTESGPHQLCVLSVLTELAHSPYTWVTYPMRLNGPVVDLSLYECSTRRKIHVGSLLQPIEFQLQRPPRSESSVHEYLLQRSQVNYHSFNITQQHLQRAIQLNVVFTPPLHKAFPIMLLFRMFERPTPSLYHLHRIYHWKGNTTRFTLPSSYLNAPGVGHLALLNADFGKAPRHKRTSEQVSYRLTVASSLCLSWDGQRGAWTHHGCRTRQADTTTAVSCSCHHLGPLTVVRQQIQSSHEAASLDPFLSVPSDLTVLCVLVLCMCLYVPGLVACKRADAVSEENRRVHHLPDNSPLDPYVYEVTVHTGPCSAACMTAKVYLVLHGVDGDSQTRELHVPGCTLFRRNSRDTFIFSAPDNLGPVWGVHIWHDNSGPNPSWYLKQVEVSEVSRGRVKGRHWLFLAQCWLAVNKGDGRVERVLQVCTQGIGFVKMLRLKLSDYLSDHHIWISVHRCPCPNSFTHTQRLSVSLLLLFGYACVNAALISQMDDRLAFDLGVIDVSAVSVTTGVVSALAVLPVAALISFLFRLREAKLTGSGVQHAKGSKTEKHVLEDALSVTDSSSEPHLLWDSLQEWEKEAWRRKCQDTDLLPAFHGNQKALLSGTWDGGQVNRDNNPLKEGSRHQAECPSHRGFRPVSQWSHYLAWTLCLLLSLSCLALSALLGTRFSTSKVLLWLQSLFFSLISCIFLIQPAVIVTVAVIVSCWYRQRTDFHIFSSVVEFETETSQLWSRNGVNRPEGTCASPQDGYTDLEKLLGARRRARYLRLVRPPTPAELSKTRGKKIRESLLYKTLRDLSVCVSMLILMLCINYGSSSTDHYHLNRAIKKQFIRGHDNAFMSIQKHEDWWKWAQTSLLNLLYKNESAATEVHVLIGEPILWKTEAFSSSQGQISSVTLVPESLRLFLSGSGASTLPRSSVSDPLAALPKTCGHLGCYLGPSAMIGFGHTKTDAASKLKRLHSGGWLNRRTVALKVQFTLFSPAPNLFTSVTMLTEQSPTGVLMPSAKVQSLRVYHTPTMLGYLVMVCQLLFLLLSLLQLCDQVSAVVQQGLVGYWRTPCNWLEVSLLTATSVYYIYIVCHSIMILELAELLHIRSQGGHVDVSLLATREQHIRSLRGVIFFLLTLKSVAVLRVNKTMATAVTLLTRSLLSLARQTISGLILMVAMSCVMNLLFAQNSFSFSSLSRSLRTLLCLHWGPTAARGPHFSWSDFTHRGVLYLSSTMWTAVVIGVVSSSVRSVARSQGRGNVFTVAQFIGFIGGRASDFTGQRRKTWIENHTEGKTYFFEEFESSVEELLFRLNALSDSLHHTLPPKAHRYREDSPVITPIQEPPNVEVQDFLRTQDESLSDHTDVSGHGETPPACHLLRSKLELEFPQQKGQRGGNSSLDIVVASDDTEPTTRNKERPEEREFRPCLKTQDYLTLPGSASLITVWTEDVLEKEVDQWTKTNSHFKLSTNQATHTDVVVEVLVHRDNMSIEADKQ